MNPFRKMLIGGAMVAATVTGGALGASFLGSANAATTPSTSSASTSNTATSAATAASQPPPAPDWSKGGHQANGKTETVLTGDDATKATAAAQAAVPGATAQRAETDADGAAYEVHMTKSDGTIVTVKLDSNFAVTQVANGMA